MIKTAIRSESDAFCNTLMRAGIPLIYAHWEGFVRAGIKAVFCYVSQIGKTYWELAPCYVVTGLQYEIKHLTKKDESVITRINAMDVIMDKMGVVANFDKKSPIIGQGNLNFKRFGYVLTSLGIDKSHYETRKQFVDKSLVGRRNQIAHGGQMDLTVDGFIDVADGVLKLLRSFKTDLEQYVSHESYLIRRPAP